jgi:uncharacterized OB-fold protein
VRLVGQRSLGKSIFPEGQGTDATHIVGSRCPSCGDVRFPARPLCPLDSRPTDHALLAGSGTIYEAVRMDLAPPGFEIPYWVGYVDLDDGVRIFARIAVENGSAEPCHGDRVLMSIEIVRRDDEPVYGPVFRRVDGATG